MVGCMLPVMSALEPLNFVRLSYLVEGELDHVVLRFVGCGGVDRALAQGGDEIAQERIRVHRLDARLALHVVTCWWRRATGGFSAWKKGLTGATRGLGAYRVSQVSHRRGHVTQNGLRVSRPMWQARL